MADLSCPICFSAPTEAPEKYTIPAASGMRAAMLRMSCPRCGEYSYQIKVSGELASQLSDSHGALKERDSQIRANASGFLYENRSWLIRNEGDIEFLANLRPPSFHDRADKLLQAVEKASLHIGFQVPIKYQYWLGRTWCRREAELIEILDYLESEKRIKRAHQVPGGSDTMAKILPDGWARLEQLRGINWESNQAFVAMWYDTTGMMRGVYDAWIAPAIREAGYDPTLILDEKGSGKIDDEIIADIKRSRFSVVDLTGQRQNVYYEAGFAHGLGIPVFFSCHKDEVDANKLGFDIRQRRCITWEPGNWDPPRKELTDWIEALIGHGKSR